MKNVIVFSDSKKDALSEALAAVTSPTETEAESSSSTAPATGSSATTAAGKDTTGSEAEMDGASALAALATGTVESDETANAGMNFHQLIGFESDYMKFLLSKPKIALAIKHGPSTSSQMLKYIP